MGLTLVTAATSLPITLEQAKAQMKVEQDDEANLIQGYLQAATAYLDGRDGILGRCLGRQTWKQTIDGFPCGREIPLKLQPVFGVNSIKYLDADGAEQTLAADTYRLVGDDWRGRVLLKQDQSWPATNCDPENVSVEFIAGYATVPAPLTQAIMLMVSHWYANREPVMVGQSVADLPMMVDELVAPYRIRSFG